MQKIDMIFYTDYYNDGYQIGVNISLDKNLSEKEYSNIHEKSGFIFKTINYGMDITKITENVKVILMSEGIKEEEISDIRISLANKIEEIPVSNITSVNKGELPHDIYEYRFYNDREVIYAKYTKNLLTHFYHQNIDQQFIYSDNRVQIDYRSLSDSPRKRNGSLNKFLKTNLETINKLENIKVEEILPEINTNDEILVTAYKLFYNEMPDFNDTNIMLKVQCMTAILHMNGYRIFPFTSAFNYYDSKFTTPESLYVKDQMLKLNLILGNDFSKVKEFNLKSNIVEKIKLIGQTIRNYMMQLPEDERIVFLHQFTVDYIQSYFHALDITDEKSQELKLLLTKDTKN